MNSPEQYILTEEELTILVFSIFSAYPILFWEDSMVWNSIFISCQQAVTERRQESV